jgi:ppGpp synthetase/RelA/SpoT-type nucleotidyltranferase
MKRLVPHTDVDLDRARDEYLPRHPLLTALAKKVEAFTTDNLGLKHIDRVAFRAKDPDSFARKTLTAAADGVTRKYNYPLEELEDQVAGRVLVFFRSDIAPVVNRLVTLFNQVEHSEKKPRALDAFSYESTHLVFAIPLVLLPRGWTEQKDMPTTFEMQVRSLAMHAWAEPQHAIEYKTDVPLNQSEERLMAFAAASAWGIDNAFESVLDSIHARQTVPSQDGEEGDISSKLRIAR